MIDSPELSGIILESVRVLPAISPHAVDSLQHFAANITLKYAYPLLYLLVWLIYSNSPALFEQR